MDDDWNNLVGGTITWTGTLTWEKQSCGLEHAFERNNHVDWNNPVKPSWKIGRKIHNTKRNIKALMRLSLGIGMPARLSK